MKVFRETAQQTQAFHSLKTIKMNACTETSQQIQALHSLNISKLMHFLRHPSQPKPPRITLKDKLSMKGRPQMHCHTSNMYYVMCKCC